MKPPPSPDGRSQLRANYAAGDSAWTISAGTRQCAPEADASMARDDWKYDFPNLTGSPLPASENKYLLP